MDRMPDPGDQPMDWNTGDPGQFHWVNSASRFDICLAWRTFAQGGQWVMVVVCIMLFVWEWALFITDLSNPEPQMQLN